MSILEKIGAGTAPPEQIIKIESPVLFNMAMSIKGDDDEIRYYLHYLLIDPAGKTLTSSNGCSLIQTPDALSFNHYQGTKTFLIKPDQKLPKDCTSADINVANKTITAYRKSKAPLTIRFDTLNYKYPDFSEVLAAADEPAADQDKKALNFNPMLLRKMSKYSGVPSVDITTVQTEKGVGFLSVKFPGLNYAYKAILMPVRS